MSSAAESPADRARMTRTYVLVVVCHTLVIAALWLFGRTFSS